MLAYTKPFISLGKIISTHGYKGEVKIEFLGNFLPKSKKMELLFVDFPPAPVPFFIAKYTQNSNSQFTVLFKNFSNPEQAKELVGKTFLLPQNLVKEVKQEETLDDLLVGFQVIDLKLGILGKVISVEEGVQDLLVVETPNQEEILIPAVEAFILQIDPKKKQISTQIPPGLVDL
ncbi:MAG: ribosome maturation factor RimM [Bacteroidia bacterium]|nr:ribosome maturation factor RimM [Bacteroidia bacterium]